MIDVLKERLYALKYARRWFPRRRRGKRPCLPTLYRYASEGYHGVVLETVQVGSTRCTSKEACARFIEQISSLTPRLKGDLALNRPKTVDQIDRALEQTGFDSRPCGPQARSGRAQSAVEGKINRPTGRGADENTRETAVADKEGGQ